MSDHELRRCERCNQVTRHTHATGNLRDDDPTAWDCARCGANGSRRDLSHLDGYPKRAEKSAKEKEK